MYEFIAMQKNIALRLALITLLLAVRPALADGYVSVYEDLPLMPGLTELPGSALSFDTPAGRIIEVYAQGSGDLAAVVQFYDSALPQLGWTRLADQAWRRDQEVLRLSVSPNGRKGGNPNLIHFSVAPE